MDQSEDRPISKEGEIYKRVKLLGTGSYGRAYLVRQISSDKEWVIKQVNLGELSPQEQETAMKQAKILEALDNPNIVRFKEVYRTVKQKLNIVMEYAEKGDLAQRIKEAKEKSEHFEEEQILKWFVQICLGVKHFHERKIIHRDLKAQNIFLTQEGVVKIGDFGVARVLDNTVAKARTVVGSPYYLSPEIIQNKPYSFKTDIWSLGALLFQLCALHPPFQANNLQFLALKIVQGSYSAIPKQYSDGLKQLIKSMLQTREASRPTIGQIFSNKIIRESISKFLTESHKPKPHPHTVSLNNFGTLKPPPDLLHLEPSENKSEIISKKTSSEQESPIKKSKTPQLGVRKGPNNFFNRPVSGRRKVEAPNQLTDLIQIKPSHLQIHQKVEKPVIQPHLPKVPRTSQKQLTQGKGHSENIKQVVASPPSSAFSKKRHSFLSVAGGVKEEKKEEKKVSQLTKIQPVVHGLKKVESKKFQKQKQKIEAKKESSKNLYKPQIRRKAPVKGKKTSSEMKLQVCSEQAKRKAVVQKKEKKVEKPKKQKPKRPTSEQTKQIPVPEEAVMQEQKCNSEQQYYSNSMSSYDYYNEEFDSYSEGSEDVHPDEDQVELEFSETFDAHSLNKVKREMENIYRLVQQAQAQGEVVNLPNFGESIPEVIHLSTDLREDDCDFDSSPSESPETLDKGQELRLTGMRDEGQLQGLRMDLQRILGEQNIVFAYHWLQDCINEHGLDFNQEQVIGQVIEARPELDSGLFRQHFKLIVTIISMEKRLD